MALRKQLAEIPIYGGVDTKSDEFQTSGNIELKNADLTKTGKVKKRTGYDILSTTKIESSDYTIGTMHSINTWNDQLLITGVDGYDTPYLYEGNKIFAYSTSSEKWNEAGTFVPIEFNTERISSTNGLYPTVAEGNGYIIFTYKDTDDSITKINVRTSDDFNLVTHKVGSIGSAYGESRAHYLVSSDGNTKIFSVLCYDETLSRIGRWSWNCDEGNVNTSNLWQPGILTDTSADADNLWDACRMDFADGYHHQCLVYKNSSDEIQVRVFDADNAQIWEKSIANEPVYGLSCRFIRYSDDNTFGRLFIMWQQLSDYDFYMTVLNEQGAELIAPTNIDTSLGSNRIGNITIARDPLWDNIPDNDGYAYTVAFEQQDDDGDGYDCDTRFIVIDEELNELAVSGFPSKKYQNAFNNSNLQAHAYTYGGKAFFPMGFDSTLQASYFIFSYEPNPKEVAPYGYFRMHGNILHNIAGPARHENRSAGADYYPKGLSETIETSTDNYIFAGLRQDRLLSSGNVYYSISGIKINMSPDPTNAIATSESLQLDGGQIGLFDGRYQQFGFPIGPENIKTGTITYASGGSVDTGTHYYKAIYEWFDNTGQKYVSSVSPALEVIVGGTDDATVRINVAPCNFSTQGTQDNIKINLYRTIVGGLIYYKAGSTEGDFDEGNPYIDDIISDANIISEEQLYTTGGVLDNVAPPASNIMIAKDNRLFLVPMDDRTAVWYSKPKVYGVGFEFAPEFVMRIDKGGDNTGLGALDDFLIIFKERSIYHTYGAGPNALGQGAFSQPKLITSDIGAVNHNSIVSMPKGLMFKSKKGIYLLDRSLNTIYLGAPVEAYNAYDVVSATLIEDKNQVIFLLSGGQPALVYDYEHNQWSTYTNHSGKHSTIYDGTYTFISSVDQVKHGNESKFRDGNFMINTSVKTGWIHPAGLQSWMRIYSFSLLGHYKSGHNLVVKVYKDYDDTTVDQTFTFTTSTGQSGDEPLQFTGDLANQKCQSIQFEIYDDNRSQTYESFELSAIVLEVAVKQGIYKQPSRKRL